MKDLNGNWLEDKATDAYGKADNITWAAIWQMVKNEMFVSGLPIIQECPEAYA